MIGLVSIRVLIVDDHPEFRQSASRLLESGGYIVVGEAKDGASALRQAAVLRPDAVLLDIVLPDRSGLLVAEDLARRGSPPRVVFVSSRDRSDFGSAFAWPPGTAFLPKHELSISALANLLGVP